MATGDVAQSKQQARDRSVHVSVPGQVLLGDLVSAPGGRSVVVFAHGSGSSRRSPRNQFVARALERRGHATLLIDLLSASEEAIDGRTGWYRFDIELLAGRLGAVIAWVQLQPELTGRCIGLFGASTGGGAALVAAARHPDAVAAIVSRGGRPDLATADLANVVAPTLLIVGDLDEVVVRLNQAAMRQMRGVVELTLVPGATHLFEEPGALQEVAEHAGRWFDRYLV
jgi:putative phosphoribosyl transferase